MLSTASLRRENAPYLSPYLSIYASAAAALASIYFLPGLTGALLGSSVWLLGMVSLVTLLKKRLNN